MNSLLTSVGSAARGLVSAAVVVICAAGARGQLVPERTYYGVNRPIPMTVKVPAEAAGEPVIRLYGPGAKDAAAS